jgi:hypothetical protein
MNGSFYLILMYDILHKLNIVTVPLGFEGVNEKEEQEAGDVYFHKSVAQGCAVLAFNSVGGVSKIVCGDYFNIPLHACRWGRWRNCRVVLPLQPWNILRSCRSY